MNQPTPHGIDRHGLDATFAADERHKSEFLLSAQLLRAQGQDEAAAARFAEAAGIEEHLSNRAAALGLQEKAWIHRFSAANCWTQAGNFYQALTWCNDLLAEDGLPERLRGSVSAYAHVLRTRRAQWYTDLQHLAATGP